MISDLEHRLVQALKELDQAICSMPRETWAPDPKARMAWQRNVLLPALNLSRSIITEVEGGQNE